MYTLFATSTEHIDRYLKDFIERSNLSICWDHKNAMQDDTYAYYSLNNFSCIDHFFMSPNLFRDMHRCDVNTSPLNPSDHRDVHISFNRRIDCQHATIGRVVKEKTAWHRVNCDDIEKYKQQLDELLDDTILNSNVATCNDPLCNNTHNRAIEEWCDQLIDCCLRAGELTLPKCNPSRSRIPLWNEKIKPLRDDSLF